MCRAGGRRCPNCGHLKGEALKAHNARRRANTVEKKSLIGDLTSNLTGEEREKKTAELKAMTMKEIRLEAAAYPVPGYEDLLGAALGKSPQVEVMKANNYKPEPLADWEAELLNYKMPATATDAVDKELVPNEPPAWAVEQPNESSNKSEEPEETVYERNMRLKRERLAQGLIDAQAYLTTKGLNSHEDKELGFPEAGTIRYNGNYDHFKDFDKAHEEYLNNTYSRAERDSFYVYSGEASNILNPIFYKGAGFADDMMHEATDFGEFPTCRDLAETLDAALAKAKKPRTEKPHLVYRGFNFREEISSAMDAVEIVQWAENKFQMGAHLEFPSYTSTSKQPKIAKNFGHAGGDVYVMFEMASWSGEYIDPVSAYTGDEREVLLPRDTKFKVVGLDYAAVSDKEGELLTEYDRTHYLHNTLIVRMVEAE